MNFLVVDIGTSKCRAAVITDQGSMISHSQVPLDVHITPPAMAEIDTEHVWRQVVSVIRRETVRHPGLAVHVMGVSAMLGYVYLDKDHEPLAPAAIWMDNRAQQQTERIRSAVGENEIYERTGRRPAPELLLPRLLWEADNRPAIYRDLHAVIGLKDEIVRRLTGTVQSDIAHANYTLLFDIQKGCYDSELLNTFGVRADLLPPPHRATDVVGAVNLAAARATGLKQGTPVISGSSDGTSAMYGGGVGADGQAVLVSGTTDVLMLRTAAPPRDASHTLTTNCDPTGDGYLTGGAMGLSGGSLARIEELLGQSAAHLADRIGGLPPGADRLLFLPGLSGERAPYWRSDLKGGFLGLTLNHQHHHLLRALMEATAYRIRRLLSRMRSAGAISREINVVGGGASLSVWNQIRADVTGMEVRQLAVAEATTLGTALFCLAGIEPAIDLQTTAQGWIKVQQCYDPDLRATVQYQHLAAVFDAALQSSGDICRELSRLALQS